MKLQDVKMTDQMTGHVKQFHALPSFLVRQVHVLHFHVRYFHVQHFQSTHFDPQSKQFPGACNEIRGHNVYNMQRAERQSPGPLC